MTVSPSIGAGVDELAPARPKHHPWRWRITRAGIVNVWHYYDTEFLFTGGRMILRGTNGSGKSRALEMLLPFLLDADRRKMDATGSGKVRLEDLMRHGAQGQTNRLGYLWLELARAVDSDNDDTAEEFLTVGAMIRFSASTGEAKPYYFTTVKRVGIDLPLMDDRRQPLSRDGLGDLIGVDLITDKAEFHRDRIGATVFGLTGQIGRERYAGLLQLLHTLRAPDMGNRIDEGNLPKILSDALPPLSEVTLREAGERLDSLSDSRTEQNRLVAAVEQVDNLLDVYRRYAARVLSDSAQQARKAAGEATRLGKLAVEAKGHHTSLLSEHTAAQLELAEKRAEEDTLSATIDGIKASDAYRAGLSLENLARSVESLSRVATGALEAADARREQEEQAVRRADTQLEQIENEGRGAASDLAEVGRHLGRAKLPVNSLPPAVTVAVSAPEEIEELVRLSLHEPLTQVSRPVPKYVEITPGEPDDVARTLREFRDAAARRAGESRVRHDTAVALDGRHKEIVTAAAHADELAGNAERDAEQAQNAADERDGTARAYAAQWRRWTAAEMTREVLGDVDWRATAIAPLLSDVDTLIGDVDDDLDHFDTTASDVAQTARQAIADERSTVAREQNEDDRNRGELIEDRRRLLDEQDTDPPIAPWHRVGPPGSVPLWRAVDFVDGVPDADRAGLEGALMAAGLLSAVVTTDGTIQAEDGQVLLTSVGPIASRSVQEVLRWDHASDLPEAVVAALLARIGVGAGDSTWVDIDGRWRVGPLQGKKLLDRARYIGTAARKAARAERLVEIGIELARLDVQDERRRQLLVVLGNREQELRIYVRSAPRSGALTKARIAAQSSENTARQALLAADAARSKVLWQREQLTADRRAHDDQCMRVGLPSDATRLAEVMDGAHDAKQACAGLAIRFENLHRALLAYRKLVGEVDAAVDRRRDAERSAQQPWRDWHHDHAEFQTLQESIGAEAEDVRDRLQAAQKRHKVVCELIEDLDETERNLDKKAGAAEVTTKQAEASRELGTRAMRDAFALLTRQTALPGVAEAATRGAGITPEGDFALGPDSVRQVEAQVNRVLEAVDRSGAAIDEPALMRAVRGVGDELTNTFDLSPTQEDGVWLVELTDATGRRPVAVAATNLREQAERAANALTDREHKVFTDFVVGGVGEELRRRLSQADRLVKAMNTSLGDIRTSHGIGVRLRWELMEPSDSPIARIRELVRGESAIRPQEDTDELIRLLKDRVDDQFAQDADAGYSTHLRTALDYRQWHRVEVSILGPEPGQVRKISRRARLSQGETRFVSYVALFAAADAYLSGLPDTNRALRVILLDDAFAKVDERTIAELMGLLVRLDVDFCMTGHALWGTYGQVPSVDVYEIRRAEGTAAVATHVHWDGHTRHYLRSTG